MEKIRRAAAWLAIVSFLLFSGARAELSPGALEEDVPVALGCKSALLMESSGQIIFEMNADQKRPVASVVKVMTILMCIEALDSGRVRLEDPVSVSKNASGMGGSQVLLDTGESQPLEVLLKSAIVGSANDAAVAIAEYIYGSQELFVKKMNERAKELGMADTVFVNCTGLPANGQHTTARDVARMSAELFRHDLYYRYSGVWMDEVDHGDGRKTQLTNTNRLIRLYDGCDGGKTGSTNEAGYCLTATAKRGDMRLIAVVLGGSTGKERFDAAEKMLDYGFANYRLLNVAERGAHVKGEMPVTGGRKESVKLMLDGYLTLLMNKSETADIELKPRLPGALSAPVKAGDPAGSVEIFRNGRLISSIPVVTVDDVPRQRFSDAWRRTWGRWLF